MSSRVYIALDRLEETPISFDTWLAAARQCDDVIVLEENRHDKIYHFVALKGDKNAQLYLSPYGLVYAQNPSRKLIVVMFKLASILNAGVYSERLNRYNSVGDWERRTRKYRHAQNNHRAKYLKVNRLRVVVRIISITILSAAFGWLLVELGLLMPEL
jgi:hypothetical protein